MTRWEFYIDQRHTSVGFAKAMFALAFLLVLVEFWTPVRMPAAVVFAIYGMWCLNASQWMQRFADMQARVDMILVAQGKEPE